MSKKKEVPSIDPFLKKNIPIEVERAKTSVAKNMKVKEKGNYVYYKKLVGAGRFWRSYHQFLKAKPYCERSPEELAHIKKDLTDKIDGLKEKSIQGIVTTIINSKHINLKDIHPCLPDKVKKKL